MKKELRIVIGSVWLVLGMVAQSPAQHLVQSLEVQLTAYDTAGNRTIHIGTKTLIRYFVGTNVPNGHLYLVTPVGNAPGTTDNLNAFLRISSGTTTVFEIPSPGEFNIYQDFAALRTNGSSITSHALNRFSIDSGSVRAELQGISLWTIARSPVNGADTSGTGIFKSSVNGWIAIYNVTQQSVPVRGTITAGRPRPGS